MLWIQFPIFILAIVVHEYAHGWVAFRLGDPTAKERGRLTLNPIKHISWLGSVLVPAILVLSKAPFVFAWAKPVPVDPRYFRYPLRDMGWVALAGPVSNFLQAIAYALIFRLVIAVGVLPTPDSPGTFIFLKILASGVLINLVLALFNLVPIPPLDGGRMVTAILPRRWVKAYARLESFGFLLVVLLLYFRGLDWLMLPLEWLLKLFLGQESISL